MAEPEQDEIELPPWWDIAIAYVWIIIVIGIAAYLLV